MTVITLYSPHDMCRCGETTPPRHASQRHARVTCRYVCASCGTRWSADFAIDSLTQTTTKENQ